MSPCHNVQFFSLSHLFDDRDFLKRNQGIFISNSFIGAIDCNFLLSWFHTTVSHYLQQVLIQILCAVFKTPFLFVFCYDLVAIELHVKMIQSLLLFINDSHLVTNGMT